jgi:hypothetical protein
LMRKSESDAPPSFLSHRSNSFSFPRTRTEDDGASIRSFAPSLTRSRHLANWFLGLLGRSA